MKSDLKILIVDSVHAALVEGLTATDIQYSYEPNIESNDISAQLKDYNALVIRSKRLLDKTFLLENKHLHFVARAGAGMENIDENAAQELGIVCFNAGEGNRDSVGEHTIGLLLNLSNKINKSHSELKDGKWDRDGNRGFEIGSKTIGIIGYGNAGSALASKLVGFDCRIIAYDKYKKGFGNDQVEEVGYQQVLNDSDIISFHIPLTPETMSWIDSSFVQSVSKPFVLLNTSRGGIMRSKGVLEGINSGKILAFGSDVLENENLDTLSKEESEDLKNLLAFDNVVITPHVAGWTHESYEKISDVLLQKILFFCSGQDVKTLHFNKETHYVG